MRIVPVDKLESGMVMGEQIQVADQIMLAHGVPLNQKYIEKLQQMGMTEVVIDDEATRDVELETTVSAKVHRKGTNLVQEVFHETQSTLESIKKEQQTSDTEDVLKDSKFTGFIKTSPMFSRVIDYTETLLHDILMSNSGIALNSIKQHDTHMFQHSVDVCAMAIAIGKQLQLPEKHLEDLALGSILHDIGKITIPKKVLNKPVTKLNSDELKIIKIHTMLGRRILLNNTKLAQRVRAVTVVTQHHEYHDGSGFPHKLKGSEIAWSLTNSKHIIGISHLAEIVNIANTFDNLTSGVATRGKPLSYLDASYIMVNRLYNRFHPAYLNAFLRILNVFAAGSNVQLYEGRYQGYVGTVVRTDPANRLSPVVRLFFDDKQQKLPKPIEVDLSKEPDMSLQRKSLIDVKNIRIDLL
ncbi:HD-GYP domain-containing protein [Desulfurispira natronophila]|uniref:HD-GYP domain-containing protein (C-di-GMP phosphodiesterase class II) n=1 Tax=Desulfurispira natronophila TaxID=682562 RepID=A0A7W7Y3V5_9BACT|nr:HD domain-containing phosphohydrolase [Desulfurispira natronophila]MBB5021606.1 HD-GYP domain-containing protein (c-di-GMP phosphodiesterase class II) [Desulfurispira natronophila]